MDIDDGGEVGKQEREKKKVKACRMEATRFFIVFRRWVRLQKGET